MPDARVLGTFAKGKGSCDRQVIVFCTDGTFLEQCWLEILKQYCFSVFDTLHEHVIVMDLNIQCHYVCHSSSQEKCPIGIVDICWPVGVEQFGSLSRLLSDIWKRPKHRLER